MKRKIYTYDEIIDKYGKFEYKDILSPQGFPTGYITIDPQWIKKNIVALGLPVLERNIRCHKAISQNMLLVWTEIHGSKLSQYINIQDTFNVGGCFCARYSVANPKKLSTHCWGIAMDVNPSSNMFGDKNGDMNMDIVAIFNKNGFAWFGDLKVPDKMHFEICKIIE